MNVTVEYAAQVKRATGISRETVELVNGETLKDLIPMLTERHGDEFHALLMEESGKLQPSILLFIGDEQVDWDESRKLTDRDVVTFLSPISGG